MFDLGLTMLIVFIYFAVILWRTDTSEDASKYFMSIDYTNTLKGLCCIIVVFVHILPVYQNKIQDAVGSFAYICVTMYMLFSGYGMAYGIRNNENFLKKFIFRRVLVIFIPFGLSTCMKYICGFEIFSGGTGYIWLIMLFYGFTYLICNITKGRIWRWTVCGFVILYSIIGRIGITIGWPVEALGFAYGIVLESNLEKVGVLLKGRKDYMFVLTIFSGGDRNTVFEI